MDFEWGFAPNPAKGTESLMINPSETPCMTKEKEILLIFFRNRVTSRQAIASE